MAFNISYVYTAVDKYSSTNKKIRKSLQKLRDKIKATKIDFRKMGEAFGRAGKSMIKTGKSMILRVATPILAIGLASLKASADFEALQISFDTMLGSAEKGKKLFDDLKAFEAATPFDLQDIANSTKGLLAAGVTAEDMVESLRMIGDVAAGAGVPIGNMSRIFAKAKQNNKAMAEELNQFTDNGIPMVSKLAEMLGKSKGEIFEMASKGKISFEILEKAMKDMTGEGGMFFQMMKKQSESLHGRFSTLVSATKTFRAALGDLINKQLGVGDLLKKMSDNFGQWAKALENASPKTKKFAAVLGVIAAVLPFVVIGLGALAIALPFVAAGFALLMGPLGLGILAFTALAVAGVFLYTKFELFRKVVNSVAAGLWSDIKGIAGVFTWLWDSLTYTIGGIIALISKPLLMIESLKNGIKGITGKIGGAFESKETIEQKQTFEGGFQADTSKPINVAALQAAAAARRASESKSQIDINLNAPEGAVKSVETRQDGDADINVGQNMGGG